MIPAFFIAMALFTNATVIQLGSSPVIAQAAFSLQNRYSVPFVNNVFADNILLTMAFMRGITHGGAVDWDEVRKPFTYSFTLKPGEVFAFHDDVLSEFTGKVTRTTNAHFGLQEGFKSDGYLVADGVCHLASLINEAAQAAGLRVVAPTNHDFAQIPEVDRKYGTSIYFMPGEKDANSQQNLYVENTKDVPVTLTFVYKDNDLQVEVTEN